MIGKGLFGFVRRMKFGKMYDELEEAGAYNIVYVPGDSMVYVFFMEENKAKVFDVVEKYKGLYEWWSFRPIRGKVYMVKIQL